MDTVRHTACVQYIYVRTPATAATAGEGAERVVVATMWRGVVSNCIQTEMSPVVATLCPHCVCMCLCVRMCRRHRIYMHIIYMSLCVCVLPGFGFLKMRVFRQLNVELQRSSVRM